MPQDAGMPHPMSGYALVDVGDARRLERFGPVVVDRPAPGADGHVPQDPPAWSTADARFDRADRGPVAHEGWTTKDGQPIEPWLVEEDGATFELRLACIETWLTACIDRAAGATRQSPELRTGAHLPESSWDMNIATLLRLLDGAYELRRLRLTSINRSVALEQLLWQLPRALRTAAAC